MLIKWYSKRKDKILNHIDLQTNISDVNSPVFVNTNIDKFTYTQLYMWINYPTLPIHTVPLFTSITPEEIETLFDEQFLQATKEIEILTRYWSLTKESWSDTMDQYRQFYFYEHHAFEKNLIRDYIIKDFLLENQQVNKMPTSTQDYPTTQPINNDTNNDFVPILNLKWQEPKPLPPQPQNTPNPSWLKTYNISRQAIRNITWYTYSPIPEWSKRPPYNTPEYQRPTEIIWQKNILEDQSKIIIVDWSRQSGKTDKIKSIIKMSDWTQKHAWDLVIWDKILNSNYESETVINLIYSKKQTYKITLENWLTHEITPEHRIPLSNNYHADSNSWDSNILTKQENYINAKELHLLFKELNKDLLPLKQNRKNNKTRSNEDRVLQESLQKKANLFVATSFNYDQYMISKQKDYNLSLQECLLIWYFLWDWTRLQNNITWNHDRLLDLITEYDINKYHKKWNAYQYNILSFKQTISKKIQLEWFDAYSYDKFLDSKIFNLPLSHKYKIIEWLLNTDWYIGKPTTTNTAVWIEYCSTSKRFIKDFQSLLLQIWIICKIRSKKIKSNFSSPREIAYYLDISDKNSLKKLNENVDLTYKLNYWKLIYFLKRDIQSYWKHSLIPLEAKEYITNTHRWPKKPNYPFQREKIENWYFKWEFLNNWLKYNWVKIKDIEFIEIPQDVVTIQVDSDDELYFSNNILTHNSKVIWERVVEESFLKENDTLVWAFMAKSTDVIRNYVLKYIKNFPDWTFIHYKSEWYIINTLSQTKLFFRTLSDWASNVLWLTLYNIIVDESQLVEDDVFENVLLPTLTTTWWRMILIWTPWFKARWYYFNKIMEAKRQTEDMDINIFERISLYTVSIMDNPLVEPAFKQKILDNRNDPAIQRQYFNNWSSNTEALFQPKRIRVFPNINPNWYIVLAIDPARLKDRSWYSLTYVINNKATVILSWQVPPYYKKKWELQSLYFSKIIEKYKQILWVSKEWKNETHFITVMDVTWVWDAVAEIFQKNWISITVKIRYTSWIAIQELPTELRVPKSILINTTLDFIQEEIFEVFEDTNKELLEEMDFIMEAELRNWQKAMDSAFFDDICNSILCGLFTIKKRNILWRALDFEDTTISLKQTDSTLGFMYWIEEKERKFKIKWLNWNKNSSMW